MRNVLLRYIAAVLLCLCAFPAAFAQQLEVCGRAVNEKTKEALPLASAQLIASDSTLYAVGLSEKDGAFCVETDSAGTYHFRLSCIGFDSFVKTITLSAETPRVELGEIALKANAIGLETAEVVGRASSLTIREDTFVYSTKAMNVDVGTTISALISQMPGVKMDKDGNLTWQGKKVESLLVNGKKFFGGDIKTALQNLPSEMVENLKLYEKKSDMAERTGIDDGELTPVIDVGIKKEYAGSWSGNLLGGGGYEDKWTGRLFLSRFSDRLQVGLSGLANNLNGDAQVDENGNWYSSGWRTGWTTFRNTNLSVGWNNKDDKKAAGYQELNASFRFKHDNTDQRSDTWQENYLPGQDRIWWNSRQRVRSIDESLTGNLHYSLNIDSLNLLTLDASLNKNRYESDFKGTSATTNDDPQDHFADHPLDHVIGDNLPEEVQKLLVNTMEQYTYNYNKSNNFNSNLQYNHRFAHTQNALNASVSFTTSKRDLGNFHFYDGRTYTNGIEHDINRQYAPGDFHYYNLTGNIYYNHRIAKAAWWRTYYKYSFSRQRDDKLYYRLDRLEGWSDLQRYALRTLPANLAELSYLLDENTHYQTEFWREHLLGTALNATFGKYILNFNVQATYRDQEIYYDRPLEARLYRDRKAVIPSVYGNVRYKFSDRTSIMFNYNGYAGRPDLIQLMDILNTSNPMGSTQGNPGLKSSWNNRGYVSFNTFIEKYQLSLWASVSGGNTTNSIVTKMTYNPATGYYNNRPENVNGDWYTNGSGGFSTYLDKEKRWNVDFFFFDSFNRTLGFLNIGDEDAQLNVVKSNNFSGTLTLGYRLEKLFATLSAQVISNSYRSSLQPQSNENGITQYYHFTTGWTAPWGMRIATDFGLWGRRNFLTRTMNTDQWLWNASISQSFLKEKNLDIKIEATDILNSRTSDLHSSTAYANTTTHVNSYQRYVIASLIYRFNWGKKKTE